MKTFKKIFLGMFLLVTVLALFMVNVNNVKADGIVTSDQLQVEGAGIRTVGNAGLRFIGTVGNYDTTNVKAYGIAIAYGDTELNANFVVGGTVNSKVVLNAEDTAVDSEGHYYVVLYNVPEEEYMRNVTARAYVILKDDTKVYGVSVTTRSLGQVALAASNDGVESELITAAKNAALTNYKQVVKTITGDYIVGSPNYEYELSALALEFITDYNRVMETEYESMVDWGKNIMGSYGDGQTKAQMEASKLYTFFNANEGEMLTKWNWLLTAIYTLTTADFVKYQINLIRGTSTTYGNWWGGRHLVGRIEGYLRGAQVTNTSFYSENFANKYENYYDQLITSTIPTKNANKLVKIGDDFVLGDYIAPKTGYQWTGYKLGGDDFLAGDSIEITSSNCLITVEKEVITYTIDYEVNGGTLAGNDPTSYNIEEAVELKVPTKDGKEFAGWNTDSDYNGTNYTTIPVGTYGNLTLYAKWINTPVCEVSGAKFETIQNGIDAAAAGGTVLVYPGSYSETLTITKNIILTTGLASNNPVTSVAPFVNNTTKVEMTGKILINNTTALTKVEIKGFTFTGSARIEQFNNNPTLDGFVFSNNYVHDTTQTTITYKHNYYNSAGYTTQSALEGGAPGFIALAGKYAWIKNTKIMNNVFYNVLNTVLYEECANSFTITGNIFKNCDSGIRCDYGGTYGTFNIKENTFDTIKYSAVHFRSYASSGAFTLNLNSNYFKNVAYNTTKLFNTSEIGILSANGYSESNAATFNVKYNVIDNCGGHINVRANVTKTSSFTKTYVGTVSYNAFINSGTVSKYNQNYYSTDSASTNKHIFTFENNFYGTNETTTVAITDSQFNGVAAHETASAYNDVESLRTAVTGSSQVFAIYKAINN